MKNILCLFDYKATTGYATVSHNLIELAMHHFPGKYHFDICAINYFGEPVTDRDTWIFSAKNYHGNKATAHLEGDDFGRFEFINALANNPNDYDGVFIIQDLVTIAPIVPKMRQIREAKKAAGKKVFKSVIYFPVDGNLLGNKKNPFFEAVRKNDLDLPDELKAEGFDIFDQLSFFDVIATYTEYGRNYILKSHPQLLDKKIKVIPHGTNPLHFYPKFRDTKDVQGCRKQYFKEAEDGKPLFIVGTINRNQPRKDIPSLIFAFIEFKKMWPTLDCSDEYDRPLLYLHMNPLDPLGWDLRYVLAQTDLKEDIDFKFPPEGLSHTFKFDELCDLYNSFDVFVTTTLGEGFGLTVTEAMGCCCPVICPDHTSLSEITGYGKRAYLLKELTPICNATDNCIRLQTCHEETAEKIAEVFNDINAGGCKNTVLDNKIYHAKEYTDHLTWSEIFDTSWKAIFGIF